LRSSLREERKPGGKPDVKKKGVFKKGPGEELQQENPSGVERLEGKANRRYN